MIKEQYKIVSSNKYLTGLRVKSSNNFYSNVVSMTKKINFIILNINAYADYENRDMAGSMRVRNLFNPILENKEVTLSNLIMLNVLDMVNDGHNQSTLPDVDCLSIGYQSLSNPLSVIKFLKRGMNFIRVHKNKQANNIIYNYQYPDIRNFLLLLYAKYKGFKIIFDLVEDNKHDVMKRWSDKIRMKFSLTFLKLIPYFADAIFVISSQLKVELIKIVGKRIPVFILPISVDFKNINAAKKLEDNQIVKIFYGGSFGPKDGLRYLIEAIEILDKNNYKFKLILSGKGHPDDMNSLFSNINKRHLVDFRGFLTKEEYFNLLNGVDICCMTRNNSAFANAGFPFKLGEFLAAGKVIIATRVGDVEKYLIHKENAYLVAPESAIEIAEGLSYCLDNLAEISNTWGIKARQVAEKHFDSQISSKFMLEKCHTICLKENTDV